MDMHDVISLKDIPFNPSIQILGIAIAVGLYGTFVGLYVIAVWTTFQQPKQIAYRMRFLATLMFALVTTHVVIQAINVTQPRGNFGAPPAAFISSAEIIIPPLTGLLSDGILAWRFLVVWGTPKWLKRAVVVFLILVGGMGLALVPCHLTGLWNDDLSALGTSWAWCFFAMNTVMTGSIVFRIQSLSNGFKTGREMRWHPSTVAQAVVESSFVAWVGVLSCAISWSDTRSLEFDSRSYEFAPVMLTALPVIFGISQTLIIARIGFVRLALTPEAQLAIADFATRMDDGAVDVEDDISWMSASNSKL